MTFLKLLICFIIGHDYKKKPITLKNYKNYIVPCKRCKKDIQVIISQVKPSFYTKSRNEVKWIIHKEKIK